MNRTYALVPANAADGLDDRGIASGAEAIFVAGDDEFNVTGGNAGLVRALVRDLADWSPPLQCETVESTARNGRKARIHAIRAPGTTLATRLLGLLARQPHVRIGRIRYRVVELPANAASVEVALASAARDVGPQYSGDNAFAARMRFHQSWFRACVLGAPFGTGPGEQAGRPLGNMLTTEDGEAGLNFLDNDIFVQALDRLDDPEGVIERYRLLHNLLSSQPMCFNLLGPLKRDLELATRVWSDLRTPWTAFGDGTGRSRSEHPGSVRRVTRVLFEHAPRPVSEYLDDRTAFDAFIEYEAADGRLGFIGIETKLTEPFSARSVNVRRHAYQRWMASENSPWLPDVGDAVADIAWNQLWRDHLLAIALRDHPDPPTRYHHACLALVRHPLDRHCAGVAERYRHLLKPRDTTFLDLTLEDVFTAVERAAGPANRRSWVDRFRARYLDLGQSEAAWQARG